MIGAAFTAVVNSVVKGVISPLVGAFGTSQLDSYKSCFKGPCTVDASGDVTNGIYILWGSVLNAVLTFVITAAVVYFLMVLPMAKYLARKAAKEQTMEEETVEAEVAEVALLREIRDTLVAQRGSGHGS